MKGIVSVTSPSSSHNVFINGLEIGAPIATDGPNDLVLSSLIVAKAATIGSAVGSFTTSDPTPGDTFTYSLREGEGSLDNGLFEITGNILRVDRDLSALIGGEILSVRVRTADAAGAFYEDMFNIEVVNDSDNDRSGFFGNPVAQNLTVTFRRNSAAEDIVISVESSGNLLDWNLIQTEVVSSISNGDGSDTVTYRSLSDLAVTTREFIRVKVTQSP